MKIKRWSPVGDGISDERENGGFVRFDDIQHLLPAENPEWEPCEIGEATHVMNAKGEVRKIEDRDDRNIGVLSSAAKNYVNYIRPDDFAFYGLTPARCRKVEPVVFEIKGKKSIGDLYNMVAKAINQTGPGKLFRVTVEVIQGENNA